jgi:putative hydrolase of HD superfamily
MKMAEYIESVYRLRFINRYTNRIRVRNEDVAQHSFFVAAIVLKLHDDYEFDLGLALQLAISHDITEADLSDVTHDVKHKHPGIAREIKKAEAIEIKKYPRAVQVGSKIFNECLTVESLIANLADVIQVQQYAMSESSLGNSTLDDIFDATDKRITKLQQELCRYARVTKNTK